MIASGCIIAQNEERYIAKAIANMQRHVSEVVILDGGSTDRTIEIATEMGCKVFHRPFDFDFSAQRNYAASCCTHDWVLWCDADEWFSEAFYTKLAVLDVDAPYSAYMVWRISRFDEHVVGEDYQPRLVNRKLASWNGKIHEGISPTAGKAIAQLPKEYSMYHEHTMQRQLYNNKLYHNINTGVLERPGATEGWDGGENKPLVIDRNG